MKKVFYSIQLSQMPLVMMDIACVIAGYVMASMLLHGMVYAVMKVAAVHAVCTIAGLYAAQCYRIVWRYATIRDFYRVGEGFVLGGVLLLIAACGITIPDAATLFIACGTGFVLLIAYRIVLRELTSSSVTIAPGKKSVILIAGAGEAGQTIATEFKRNGRYDSIIGFVDDDKKKVGTLLSGKPVLGTTGDIPALVQQYTVKECIIAMPSAPKKAVDRIISIIQSCDHPVTISILPAVSRLFEKALTPELKGIGVEELIGRQEIQVDSNAIEQFFAGKVVLVTGAGGSIGSEACRQLLHFRAKTIVAVGRGEHSIYNLTLMLNDYAKYFDKPDIRYYIADINDATRMRYILNNEKPDIVFHAAAHKYVDIMEQNPQEAVRNNCLGTVTVLEASKHAGVKQFVCISTDKAVHPVSVMGATKRIAEMVTLAYNNGMRTCCVRFGNVIGSRGSVIPLFYKQIAKGGPVTITHPDMTRYFMSIPEAVMLVINATVLSQGGEIFVLDMGKQYRVEEVARNLIALLGYQPDVDIPIVYTGVRPGEKLQEELWNEGEELVPTAHTKIYTIAHNGFDKALVNEVASLKADHVQSLSPVECKRLIQHFVKDYNPYEC